MKISLKEFSMGFPDFEIEFIDKGYCPTSDKYVSEFIIKEKSFYSHSSALDAEERLKDDKKVISKALEMMEIWNAIGN